MTELTHEGSAVFLADPPPAPSESLAAFTARMDSERASLPLPSGRLVVDTHPTMLADLQKQADITERVRVRGLRIAELGPIVGRRAVMAKGAGEATWKAGDGSAEMVDFVSLKAEYDSLLQLQAHDEAALVYGQQARDHYHTANGKDGQPPLRMILSRECCQAAAPEFFEAVQMVRANVLLLEKSMRAAEAILVDLERGGTTIVAPLDRPWGPLSVHGAGDSFEAWIGQIDKYLRDAAA